MMQDVLLKLLENCPDAEGAALMDPDGIPVLVEPRSYDVEVLGAEMASMVQEMAAASRELQHGSLKQLEVATEKQKLLLTTIVEGYFLLLFMEAQAVAGRAKFYSRVAREALYSELA